MDVWFPFGHNSNNGADESNLQQRGAEENLLYDSSARTSQFLGLVGKEAHGEESAQTPTASNTNPLMSAAAAAMAQSFFTREPIGVANNQLNSLLTATAASNRQYGPYLRTEGFPQSTQSPASSAASEQSVPSPNRNYFSPSAEGYARYINASVSRIGTPIQPHPPPQTSTLPPPPAPPPPPLPPLPPPSVQPPPSYTAGRSISSSTDLNVGSTSSGNFNSNMEQIWPWMTVVACCIA
ncbi:hypothetical protein Aperf_G00000029372 [Anoplocephala perfoliata]